MNRANARDLTTRIEFLRNKQTALMSGSGKLLAYGIIEGSQAVARALTFTKVEARHIADQLDAQGHDGADARQGWAIILPPPVDRPEYARLIDYPACRTEGCANNPAQAEANCTACRTTFFAAAEVFATFDADPWREWIIGLDAELSGPLPPGYEPSVQERHLITTLAATMGYTVEWSETPRRYGTARAWWNLTVTGWPEDE
ncbi:MAG TPA: hypothetical protein VFC19_28495 [Candidatus Limnocylindrales bacterium]|nr:hypothetical protein [Candidatus Limnocylindrales bacterium]